MSERVRMAGHALGCVKEVVEVIDLRGAGVEGDPIRRVFRYFDKKGRFLAERDTVEADDE